MNIIECTIAMKQGTHAHYRRLAEAVGDTELQRLFSLLADEEQKHIGLLQKINSRVRPTSDELTALEASVCAYRPMLNEADLNAELDRDPDAFRHVVKDEEETIEFFDLLARECQDARMKKLCLLLARQERKHLATVENIYDFVEEPRTYLEWGEFSNLHKL
ncbi:ferritin family protein [Geobacter sp. SVR]|uniref:ferritin-like domain-containing protein n=1 Tax=Geobacter sp. SVR TaxID=2495594 RepID=UPI00143F0262|nr:ferritin family protein [Geobacter sp. SVR]BCS55915.1 ferritin [Geobacter sp. SVR]GCF84678.1 ferritin [Geobacter sp. SVR]